jgi:plastocyanin
MSDDAPMRALATLLPLLLLAGPATARRLSLEGRVELVQQRGVESPESVVVYFTPRSPVAVAAAAEPFEVVTAKKEFLPRVLVAQVGSRVRFPNQDPILHNVFSVSGGNAFDLGLYGRGPGEEVELREPGVVRVFCNVHHSMVAYLLVLDTPFSTSPDRDGRFRLEGLPAGPGTLTVWQERAEPLTRELTLPAGAPLELRLELTKPRVPRHLNKLGKPYSRDGSRPYR